MIYGNLVKHITFPVIAKKDGMVNLHRHRSELDKTQFYSKEKIADLQLKKLKSIVKHAYKYTDFYRKRFDDVGFDPGKMNSLEDLKRIPPLLKKDLQKNLHLLISKAHRENEIHKDATGGSTGSHTPFYRDNACVEYKKAVEYRCNSWAGWDIGKKIAYYWPALQDFAKKSTLKMKIKNMISYRALMLYSGKLDNDILEQHYKALYDFRPFLLRAFPNPLSILAKFIKDHGKETLNIPSIISVGEPLLESQRTLFKEIFGSDIYNCYVSRECGNMACECDQHGYLHINSDMVYIEFEENRDDSQRDQNKILVTDLTNFGMPLIKYKIEDMGVAVKKECACGRGLPLMSMDAGRVSDFLVSPFDKSKISGASFLHHMIAEGPDVGQIQVIQTSLDHINIKILKSINFSKDKLTHFDKVIDSIFRGKMTYEFEYVDIIPHEKSGKYFFTKSLLSENEKI